MSYTVGTIFGKVRGLLNDNNDKLFHDDTQLPYIKIAQQEFEQELLLAECQVTCMAEAEITVPASSDYTELTLPASFFLPISLQEKGAADTFYNPMTEVGNIRKPDRLPRTTRLCVWDFRHNCINLVGATQDQTVQLNYWRVLPPPESEATPEYVMGGENSLAFRTAALCAFYIGKDKVRSDDLNAEAINARDLLTSLYTKNKQGVRRRRKPFRLARRRYT